MIDRTVENVVVGAGTAGLAAYRALRDAGREVLLVEAGPFGTTCARVGCMPSKLLIAAAEAAHGTARWDTFGLRLEGKLTVDGRAVMQRLQFERDRFVGFVLDGVAAIPEQEKLVGHARFVAPRVLEVGESTRVHFERVVIATGSAPAVPESLRALGDRVVVNDDVFAWQDLPRSVAVVGPGVIGLELGQALHRLGVRVHVLGRGHGIGPLTDPVLKETAAACFRQEFPLETDVRQLQAKRLGNGVQLQWENAAGHRQQLEVDEVIAATGRVPNVAGLGLDRLGIALQPDGVPVFDPFTLQCGQHPVFVAGDVNNDRPLLHEAADEGRIAGENAAHYPEVRKGVRRAPLAIVFTEPQIALVGQRWADLDPAQVVVGKVSFENQGRSRVMLRNQGALHLYADREGGTLRGAELVGPEAEHLAHLLAWALQLDLTVPRMLQLPFYHPVVEEGLRTALRDAASQLGRGLQQAA